MELSSWEAGIGGWGDRGVEERGEGRREGRGNKGSSRKRRKSEKAGKTKRRNSCKQEGM